MTVTHLDEHGRPCTRHAPAGGGAVMSLATAGARLPGFHHDLASRLQSVVMALDELEDLTRSHRDPQVQRNIAAAQEALHGALELLADSRELTKPPVQAVVALRELVDRAGARVQVVVRGELPAASIRVAVSPTVHALSLVFDVAAAPAHGRSVAVVAAIGDDRVQLAVPIAAEANGLGEAIAIATFVLARDGGDLCCASDGSRLFAYLPLAR